MEGYRMRLDVAIGGFSVSSRKTCLTHRTLWTQLPTIPYHPFFLSLAALNAFYPLTYSRYCTKEKEKVKLVQRFSSILLSTLRDNRDVAFELDLPPPWLIRRLCT